MVTELPPRGVMDLGDGWFLGYERGEFENGSLSAASIVHLRNGNHHVVECSAWRTSRDDLTMLRGLVAKAGRAWPVDVPSSLPRWIGDDRP